VVVGHLLARSYVRPVELVAALVLLVVYLDPSAYTTLLTPRAYITGQHTFLLSLFIILPRYLLIVRDSEQKRHDGRLFFF
jgi:hypothetical protein